MSKITSLQSRRRRITNQIHRLQSRLTRERKKEASINKNIGRLNKSIQRTKNINTLRRRQREIERESKKYYRNNEKQAEISSKISKLQEDLSKVSNEIDNYQIEEQKRLLQKQHQKVKKLSPINLESRESILNSNTFEEKFDVFISHSSEDKASYVDKLAEELRSEGITIWYDSENISWGKSIRQEIDNGLRYSKYGIVVLSPSFLKRYWTNYELDGILNIESSVGRQMILPIWHNITADEIQEYSSSLSNRLAMNSYYNTIEEIVKRVKGLVKD